MIRRPPRSTLSSSSAASDVYKRQMIAVMQFGDWGVEASEAIRVTDKGCELFCNFSKELHIKS